MPTEAAEHCALDVIQTEERDLSRYQLSLQCPALGKAFRYEINVIKTGPGGSSNTSQSGKGVMDATTLTLGNIKVNTSPQDNVEVTGTVRDSDNQLIAETSKSFPSK
ncbi:MAG: hypothetical protein VX379_08695 [Pseudomonadota bacterium]|nr:hypothetical protein [Pseudomonadota bacterium]MEE3321490.1 hypothetical protein [Pseudomonadota bacterium]